MDEVCYIPNKNKLPNNLAKRQYFYTRDFISLLHFETNLALSIEKVFRSIHFLPLFYYFQKRVRFVIFQVNADVLINQLKFFYTRYLTHLLFQIKVCVLHRRCFWNHPLFTTILVFTVDEVCYISYKYQPPNNLAKRQYFYARDFTFFFHLERKLALSIVKVFRSIHFLPVFYYF